LRGDIRLLIVVMCGGLWCRCGRV